MDLLFQDLRFGARILLRTPAITGSILLVLALGIGANAAMFGIVDRLILHPVDYPDPQALVFVWSLDAQGSQSNVSPADFMDWRAQSKSLDGLAGWVATSFVVSGGDQPRQVAGARVTSNFFRTLQVKPALGRTFLPDEDGLDRPENAAHSAVISYRMWQEDLGADPNILGRTIRVDWIPYVIVGVAPPNFSFRWRKHDIWIPVSLKLRERDYRNIAVIARLRTTRARAAAEMSVIARSLSGTYPASDKGWTIRVDDFREFLLNRTFRARLLLLFGSVGLVLLIACTNIASLLLARSSVRAREIAVRASLGASRWRLTRQLLTESALLALMGGGLGLAVALALIRALPKIVPPSAIPGGPVGLSAPLVWFTLAISAMTSILFGLAPAMTAARSGIQATLRQSGRGSTAGLDRRRFSQTMVAAEVALALMLLASAWLMIGSLRDLTRVDPGFDPKNVLIMRVFLPAARYDPPQAMRFYRLALERIGALPGVKSATLGSTLPLINTMEVQFDVEGAPPRSDAERANIPYAAVGPDYFRALGIPLRRGRWFRDADDERAPLIAILNEALVARVFPNEDPIGKRLVLNRPIRFQNGFETVKVEVVGVVGNVKLTDLSADPKPIIYVPYLQNPFSRAVWFAARTELDPLELASAVRTQFASIDREQPIEQVSSLDQLLADQFAPSRFQTRLMSAFALVALLLAMIGIYGVNAYAVAQRSNEIGVRMALGATHMDVVRDILTQGMRPTAIGIALGLTGAEGLASWLKSVLVGTATLDPLAFLGAAILLAIVAAAACYIPARKATRIDPAIALRAD
jgi:predicted permease